MKTMKHNKWWILLLSMVFVVIGMACSSDEPDENYVYRGNHKYYPSLGRMFLQLDKKDNRFKDLKTIDELKDVRYDIEKMIESSYSPMTDTLGLILRNDSIFLLHNGTIYYPTRLPDDFWEHYKRCANYTFSGIVKEKPRENVDFYPLILTEFMLGYYVNFYPKASCSF